MINIEPKNIDLSEKELFRELELLANQLQLTQLRLEQTTILGNIGLFDWLLANNDVQFSGKMFSILGVDPENFSVNGSEFIKYISNVDFEDSLIHIASGRERNIPNQIIPVTENPLKVKILKPDGSKIWIRACIYLKNDTQGEPERLMGTVRDITSEKMLEEELLQSQRLEASGALLGKVVHEFKNSLMAIDGYATLALDSIESENVPVMKTSLLQIKKNTQRSTEVVNHLLQLSKKNSTELRIINPFMSIIEFLKVFYIIEKKVEIYSFINENLGLIATSSSQLMQIGTNLLTNAIHAVETKKNGKIIVSACSVNCTKCIRKQKRCFSYSTCFQLKIKDNGIGIANENLSKIFTPFFTTKEKGTGLGLAIVSKLVEEANGVISVESEVGRGSIFTICIPQVEKLKDEHIVQSAIMQLGF